MESMRLLRLAPLALAVAAGASGIGRPMAGAVGDPPWEPPPCPAGEDAGPPGAGAWYRMDPVLDRQGVLASMRLTVGVAGERGRWLVLAPESFASGPVADRVLAGTDDGTSSHLRLLDPGRGCASAVADEAAVIRSAVMAPDGASILEHRVDRRTRADLGVWRRSLGVGDTMPGVPVRVLPGLAADESHGRTFTTELLVASDGSLVVSSCGPEACRDRVLDAAGVQVTSVDRVGPALGVDDGRLVARDVCAGDPCGVIAVDLVTGARDVLVGAASAAVLDGHTLVYEADAGRVAALEIGTGRRSGPVQAGGIPMSRGSLALAGAAVPAGDVAIAPSGRPTPTDIRSLDTTQLTATDLTEVRR
ncbi:MAG TPA: hypothetical protein VES19_08565 [Candidatus Limnocylindrales bacterium]|nr:hypothetical protein [Candidatus Limnocylindrales bacterium]